MNVLLTGGSGSIGTALFEDLRKSGHKVIIYDKERSERYPDLCIVADMRNRQELVSALIGRIAHEDERPHE